MLLDDMVGDTFVYVCGVGDVVGDIVGEFAGDTVGDVVARDCFFGLSQKA